jgi:hypothetical protein
MSKDKRKNIYSIIITSGRKVCDVQTFSSFKHAEEKLARLEDLWFRQSNNRDWNRKNFRIELKISKLQRQARNMGAL